MTHLLPSTLLIAALCAAVGPACHADTAPAPAQDASPPHAAAQGAHGARPNILFILVDDMGWGDLGVLHQNARAKAGKPAIGTPNLDTLAHEGVRLTDHYCGAPVCAPSRGSLMAGVTQGHAGVRDNQFDKALEDNHTLASVLHQAGYATCAIGKWGMQGASKKGAPADCPAHPQARGFDDFFGYLSHVSGHEHYPKEYPLAKHHKGEVHLFDGRRDITAQLDKCYTADLFTAKAKDWITRHHAQHPAQPFFMYLAFDTPHAALELPTEAYPAGGGLSGGLRWLGTPGHMISTAEGQIDSFVHPDFRKPGWPEVQRRYATSVRRLDEAVGDLAQLLKDLKLDENTLVVFTSDNGPSIESYLEGKPVTPEFFASFGPFDGIKRDCWEGGARVPALVRWPGHVRADAVSSRPSSFTDWMATCADLAGLPAPARCDGVSLLHELTGEGAAPPQKPVYIEYAEDGRTPKFHDFAPDRRGRKRGQMQLVRLGDKVGVRYDIRSGDEPFEIYDIRKDPGERRDLAKTEPALEQAMQATALGMRRPDASAPRPYDKALIPAVAVPAQTAPGWHYAVYASSAPWVPATSGLPPLRQGDCAAPDLAALNLAAGEAVEFTGLLRAPADGEYTLSLAGNGRAFLRVHEAAVVDADRGAHLAASPAGKILLKAGWHPLSLAYVAHDGFGRPVLEPKLALTWKGPATPEGPVPVEHAAP